MKLGILGTSDIAYRRFLPALLESGKFRYAGIASRTPDKALRFQKTFGEKIYQGYEALISDQTIDAVYVPLPPALHFKWGKRVLEEGKHLLLEKPFTTSLANTQELLCLAAEKGLAVHENYMFLYHSQLNSIRSFVADGVLGEIRLLRMSFGFPKRSASDFRYSKELGGGALLDCGGYPVRLALELLGASTHVVQASSTMPNGYEVDLFGNAVLENEYGVCAQISFGMDNAYQCTLEIWGSDATLITSRIFTAGPEVEPQLILRSSTEETSVALPKDNSFLHSIEVFSDAIAQPENAAQARKTILRQAELIESIRRGDIHEN